IIYKLSKEKDHSRKICSLFAEIPSIIVEAPGPENSARTRTLNQIADFRNQKGGYWRKPIK
ncbi:hypothetical protein M8C21_018322, partial [Ambrosia artemisiifolia]